MEMEIYECTGQKILETILQLTCGEFEPFLGLDVERLATVNARLTRTVITFFNEKYGGIFYCIEDENVWIATGKDLDSRTGGAYETWHNVNTMIIITDSEIDRFNVILDEINNKEKFLADWRINYVS